MILAFGDDNWRAACFERRQDVIEDQIITRRVLNEPRVQLLNGRLFIRSARRVAETPYVGKRPCDRTIERRLLSGIDAMTDRAALHEDDRVMAILPRHCRGQTQTYRAFAAQRDRFEAHGRKVMALIDNDMSVISDQIRDDAPSKQALHEGDIDDPGRLLLSPMDKPEVSAGCPRRLESRDPLIE